MAQTISMNVFKSLLGVAFMVTGCSSQFKADLLTDGNMTNSITNYCDRSFVALYAGVATEVNGKSYSDEISKDPQTLERVAKACDALMLAAPHGQCAVKANDSEFTIDDRDFKSICLQASHDLAAVKSPGSVSTATVKTCSESFLNLYENVEKLVSDKDYESEIKKDSATLKKIVKACDALLLLAPYGECKIKSSQSGTIISDFDFQDLCLNAAQDLQNVDITPVTPSVPVLAPYLPSSAAQTQATVKSIDLLRSNADFEIKTTNPAAMATLINSQKIRNNYILYFVGGTRLTHSPTTDQIGIGCSVYTGTAMTGADFAMPMNSPKKSIKAILAGVVIHFELNANGKIMNLQCFKKTTAANAAFTLSDIQKHLGTYFQVLQK